LINFILNDEIINTTIDSGTTVLDFIRYRQYLTGTKIGCREGDCGACTILVGEPENDTLKYHSVTSCLMPIGNVHGKHIVTIEGINNEELTPVQQAFADHNASQCGFCTPGFIIALTGFCLQEKEANREKAIAGMDGNICRCTGYQSIIAAAGDMVNLLSEKKKGTSMEFAIAKKIVPSYFENIPKKLNLLNRELPAKDNFDFMVAGGTDLYVQKHDVLPGSTLRFAKQEKAGYITETGNQIEMGAATSVTEFLDSEPVQKMFHRIGEFGKLVSSTPIRNMSTIAGNFINASPIGDFTVFFLTLHTVLYFLHTKTGKTRSVLLNDFYKGYKILDKEPGEILTHFCFDKPSPEHFFNFEKVSKRTYLDIASVNSAMYLQRDGSVIKEVKISAGGVGPVPMLLVKTGEFCKGKEITEETIGEAIQIMHTEISPISDARGTAAYKKLLLEQLIRIHFKQALAKISNDV
jgi:xanthine dehydrogenase small subunit